MAIPRRPSHRFRQHLRNVFSTLQTIWRFVTSNNTSNVSLVDCLLYFMKYLGASAKVNVILGLGFNFCRHFGESIGSSLTLIKYQTCQWFRNVDNYKTCQWFRKILLRCNSVLFSTCILKSQAWNNLAILHSGNQKIVKYRLSKKYTFRKINDSWEVLKENFHWMSCVRTSTSTTWPHGGGATINPCLPVKLLIANLNAKSTACFNQSISVKCDS